MGRKGSRLRIALGVSLAVAVVAIGGAFLAIGRQGPSGNGTSPETTQASESRTSTGSAASTGAKIPAGFAAVSPPKELAAFAKSFATYGEAWFPTSLPRGYKLDSAETSELGKGSGPLSDVLFLNGDLGISLTQGSPKLRDYEILALEKVPWGTATASVVYDDPEDTTSAKYIVYSDGKNLAELSGDVPIETLEQIAAGMVVVAP
jgi:hypothetical protein